jgi:hypothetical protein
MNEWTTIRWLEHERHLALGRAFKAYVVDIVEPLVSEGYITEAIGVARRFILAHRDASHTRAFLDFASTTWAQILTECDLAECEGVRRKP